MDLGNLAKTVVHHLLIKGMNCFNYQNKVSMVSVLVCMVTHWTRFKVNHDVRL